MHLTPEQKEIVATDLYPGEVLKVVAFAGTGKTATLVEFAKARPKESFLYLSFNKSIAQEARRKFPRHVEARTTHSLAYGEYGRTFRHKIANSIKANQVSDNLGVALIDAKFALETLSHYMLSADIRIRKRHIPKQAWPFYEKAGKHRMPDLVSFAQDLWTQMIDPESEAVPSVHDTYLKLFANDKPRLNYSYLMVDEAQDSSPVVTSLLDQEAALILVGDNHQSIFSWRNSQSLVSQYPSSKTLYLTRSFRFGRNIAAVSNLLLKVLKGEGKEILGASGKPDRIGNVSQERHAVLCRTNAGVFSEAVSLLDEGHALGYAGGLASYRPWELLSTYYLLANKGDRIRDPYIGSFECFQDLKEFAEATEDAEILSRCKVVERYKRRIPGLIHALREGEAPMQKADIVIGGAFRVRGLEFDYVRLSNDFCPLVEGGELVDFSEVGIDDLNVWYVSASRARLGLQINEKLEALIEYLAGGDRSAAA